MRILPRRLAFSFENICFYLLLMAKRVQRGYRGLAREELNSDFMRLKNYEVIDNPKLKHADGLNSLKRPDHRIDGTVFDSYAPRHSIRDWDWFYEDPESEFELLERCKSDLSPVMREAWQGLQRGLMRKGIAGKVGEGQTRNILLNLSDTSDKGQLLCNEEFADLLSQVKELESVVCIYPKKEATSRGNSSGKGETWKNYIPSDMEAVRWVRGMSGFRQLPDGKGRRSDESEEDEFEDEPTGRTDDKQEVKVLGDIPLDPGIGGFGFSILSALGIFALAAVFEGFIGWLSFFFGLKKKKTKRDSKWNKSAVVIYRRYMSPIVVGMKNKPRDLAATHDDLKTFVDKLLPPTLKDLDKILIRSWTANMMT